MPRNRDDSNPLEAKRRQLEQQEKRLAEMRRELKEQLESHGEPAAAAKIDEPPVWRMEDDPQEPDLAPARYRHLARQRQRDMVFFFACIAVLLVVIAVLLWVVLIHKAAPAGA